MNPAHPLTARRIAAIKAALGDSALNAHEIAPLISLCFARTEDYLGFLVEAEEIHIKRWTTTKTGKQQRIPHYALGPGKNARKPRPFTGNERAAISRARRRKDKERHELHLASERTRKRLAALLSRPQTWFAALGAP